MTLTNNALTVLNKRYLLRDEHGQVVETAEGLFERVAAALAEPDRLYGAKDVDVAQTARAFYDVMTNLEFLPNSPTLANAGTPLGQLSACFVLPVPDDLTGIFEAIKLAALIHQSGGGTGFAFSRLRPKNDLVQSTKGVSSGPVSFMDVFNAATESIKQGGMRRGANMGILRVDHPDILDFVKHKEDLSKLTNFNISVAVTDVFMAAVEAGGSYDLVNPRDGAVVGQLDARHVFRQVVQRAWSTGEPGLVFIDRMNRYCPVPWMGGYEATNPCGEQPLIPYESCNLGSINLERFVADGPYVGPLVTASRIDWDRLRRVVHVAVHLLDNVIDANRYPVPEIEAVTKATRKIGLGVMGFGRMLFRLGVAYGSPESLVLAEQVMSFIDWESKVASVVLAKSRGAFPEFRREESSAIYLSWCAERAALPGRHPEANWAKLATNIEACGIRNSTTTTVAPTGTLSIIADTSGGCEPVFALTFERHQADEKMVDADGVFRSYLDGYGFTADQVAEVFALVQAHHGSLRLALAAAEANGWADFVATPADRIVQLQELASFLVVAHDITPEEHVRVQAAFQAYNDSATSKTINFPESATVEDVETAYRLAWDLGCKGITVYRNDSRGHQPLSVTTTTPTAAAPPIVHPAGRPRPEVLYGFTREVPTGDGKLYAGVNYDDQGIREVITTVGRSGSTLGSLTEAIGRLISLGLENGVAVEAIAGTLAGIRGANPYGFGAHQVLSIPDAISKVLRSAPRQLAGAVLPAATPVREELQAVVKTTATVPAAVGVYGASPECPECSAPIEFGEGCATCRACGYSRCG